jgi:hypothetical protein
MNSKLQQKIHNLRVRVLTDNKIKIGLYISVALIVLILLILLSTTFFSSEKLVRHNIKSCYNKVDIEI